MRLILLALLPAALAACGGESGYSGTDGTMPAPGPSMEEAADAAAAKSGTTNIADLEPMSGDWTTGTDRGDASASFSAGGETLLTVICRSGAGEDDENSLVVQRMISEDRGGESIDFLTSAGNTSISAVALELDTPAIGGSINASANGVSTLANANDAIRVRSGDDEIIIPASEEMKSLINDCRPEAAAAGSDGDAAAEEETTE